MNRFMEFDEFQYSRLLTHQLQFSLTVKIIYLLHLRTLLSKRFGSVIGGHWLSMQ